MSRIGASTSGADAARRSAEIGFYLKPAHETGRQAETGRSRKDRLERF